MAGIYIHIPFCKQACHYCDFHFSTSLKHKTLLINALCRELEIRQSELKNPIETIYFGGGTPSLLTAEELQQLIQKINELFLVEKTAEITLEANPDDLSIEKIEELQHSEINRLSIGVQSFFEEDLRLMNRAHTSAEAVTTIELAKKYFDNISIDLIYGIPGMSLDRWKQNLKKTLAFEIPHISSYALTVEPNTALKKFIERGKITPVDEAVAKQHYDVLLKQTKKAGLTNYEFSNFGKPGYFSKNNTAYWMGKPYLGIGPSAHSFDGVSRSWNVANNPKYIKSIEAGILPNEKETLTISDRYNEYIMTRLRTIWGVSLAEIEIRFGEKYVRYFQQEAQAFFKKDLLQIHQEKITVSQKGKFLTDGIASGLFFVAE